MADQEHRVGVTVEHQTVFGWKSYEIECNLIVPADAFTLTAPFSQEAYRVLRTDARVRVSIDRTPVLDGFIDKRTKNARDGSLTISGRCRGGRLLQESAPTINYSNMRMFDAIEKLAGEWVPDGVTSSDARNRNLRRGKGVRVPAAGEPVEINIPVPRAGRVHPGASRWQIIEEIASQSGTAVWLSVDGKTIYVGKPNQNQTAQYKIVHVAPGSKTRATCLDLVIDDDIGDCYSIIRVVGTGGGDDVNHGADVVGRRGVARDGINSDGTGNHFLYRKELIMPERNYSTNNDAQRIANREMARRLFKAHTITATMPGHGQILRGERTIFAPNTIAQVVDEDIPYDEDCLVVGVTFACDGQSGETTRLELVPKGTEVVL